MTLRVKLVTADKKLLNGFPRHVLAICRYRLLKCLSSPLIQTLSTRLSSHKSLAMDLRRNPQK